MNARKELANLDCLRTFAVMAVLYDHWQMMTTSILTGRPSVNTSGYVGVMAFFVHTSLVLMLSLDRMQHRFADRLALRFYIRRAFRLYPLSVLCVLSALWFRVPAVPAIGTAYAPFSGIVVGANLLLAQNFVGGTSVSGPLWSLPFEIDMYLVLPVLFFVALKRDSWKVLFVAFLAFSGIGLGIQAFTGHANLFAFIPSFICGVLAFSLREVLSPKIPAKAWPLALGIWFLVFSRLLDLRISMMNRFVIQWLMSFVLGASIYLFHDSTNQLWNRVTGTVAKYSYGIYLSHLPMLWLVIGAWKITNPIAMTALWLLMTALASVLAYHVLEEPMIEVGKRISVSVFRSARDANDPLMPGSCAGA